MDISSNTLLMIGLGIVFIWFAFFILRKVIGLVVLIAVVAGLFFFFNPEAKSPLSTWLEQSTDEAVVMRTPGGLLEVSSIASEERFDSTIAHEVLGMPVGHTTVQVKVPAVYRYHIPLANEWKLQLKDQTLLVVAPPVNPTLPVAIDTTKLETFATGIWSPITGKKAIDALQTSITPRLAQKAKTPEMLIRQREYARKTVSEFIEKWVIEQPKWKGTKTPSVKVVFEDEPQP